MDLSSWYTDTATYARISDTTGDYGDYSYGTKTSFVCRYQDGRKYVRTLDGQNIECIGILFTSTELHNDDAIWLPGEDTDGPSRKIQKIRSAYDKHGTSKYYVVYIGDSR